MDEENTAVETAGETEVSGFAAGFADDVTPPPAETPAEPPAEAPAPAEPPAAPKYAQITEDEYKALVERAAQIDEIKADTTKKLDTAFGKLGDLNRVIAGLQQNTPTGQAIEVSEQDFSELLEQYPEMTALQIQGLNRVLSKFKGTGGIPSEQVGALVDQRVKETIGDVSQIVEATVSERLLKKEFGDWRSIVGAPDDSKNEFRQWLKSLPAQRQSELNTTYDSDVISSAIRDFQAAKKKADEIQERKSRLAAAVTPRSAPGNASPIDDDESAGFKAGWTDG